MKEKKGVATFTQHGTKSLICHIVFFCELDLYGRLWGSIWADIGVLSAGGFQRAEATGICIFALLSACQSRYRLTPGVSVKQSHRG